MDLYTSKAGEAMNLKECLKCKHALGISEFYKDKYRKDGLDKYCKPCERKRPRINRKNAYKDKLKYIKKYPERQIARLKVFQAIKNGLLIRPKKCSGCFITCKPHAHHEDYSKPLLVLWLCALCHSQLHKIKKGDKP